MDISHHTPASSSVAALPGRDRVLIWTCLFVITALAWWYLIHLDRQMSSAMEHDEMMAMMGMAMDMPPWTPADILFTFAMWVVMMAGMMVGTAAPVMLLFAGAHVRRGSRSGAAQAVLVFGLGYLVVWIGFSACAALAQWALHLTAMLSPAMAASSSYLAGAILFTAGAYQLTWLKRACLMHCRSPLGFLIANWRDGTIGALSMGLRHGAYCLGCCWALMGLLFVVGVMNLFWVAALTGFVLVEKTGPAGVVVARVAGAAMIVFGILLLAGVV